MNKVLVIDDDLASGILVKDILTSTLPRRVPEKLEKMFGAPTRFAESPGHFNVTLATSGLEGVEIFAKAALSDEPVMMAFVDLTLKDINGLDAGYRLREFDDGIKIVFFSGRDFSDAELTSDKESLLKSVFYLQKPFVSSEIRQYALALCEERKTESEMRKQMAKLLSAIENQNTHRTAGR